MLFRSIYKNGRKIDIIITDLRMPVMSGQTFILEVRKYEEHNKKPKTPIIVVTAESSTEEKKLCLTKYGANEYLIKPIKYQDLVSVISKVFSTISKERCKRVLIVDDDAISSRFLAAVLAKEGHKCVSKYSIKDVSISN